MFIPWEVGESSWRDDAAPSSVGSGGSRAACGDPGRSVGTDSPAAVSSRAGVGAGCSGVEGGSRRHAVAPSPKSSECTRIAGRILWRGSCSIKSCVGAPLLLVGAVSLSFACSMSLLGGGLKRWKGASPSCLDGATPAGLSSGCGISGVAVGNDHPGRSGRRELNVRCGPPRELPALDFRDERVTYHLHLLGNVTPCATWTAYERSHNSGFAKLWRVFFFLSLYLRCKFHNMDVWRMLTGGGRQPARSEHPQLPTLYSPTVAVNLAPVLQELRFNWGGDPLLGSYEVDLAGCTEPDEDTVAFFGAVDSRPLLFLMSVALLSTRRFHPQAGFFILVPVEHVVPWTHLVRGWTGGAVRLLALERAAAADFGSQDGGYSRMTFHRHRVPEMLVQQGFAYSVNLDPDVLCVQPWDLRILCKVGLIAGRRVGKGSRTVGWLQQRLSHLGQPTDEAGLLSFLNSTLGITTEALSRIPEINGGVVVFNNLRATRERWFHAVRERFSLLANVVEGDQDLISAPRTPHLACLALPQKVTLRVLARQAWC